MKTTFIIIVIFIVIIVLSLLQFLDECFVASLFVDSRLPSNEKTCLRLSEKTDYGFGFHGLGFKAL